MSNDAVIPSQLNAPVFIVVDEHRDTRYFLVRTLLRKFPAAVIEECGSADVAINWVSRGGGTAVVLHRTYDVPDVELIGLLRELYRKLPIIMVSGKNWSEAAIAAGADHFLPYDEWLKIGTVMEQLLEKKAGDAAGAGAPAGDAVD